MTAINDRRGRRQAMVFVLALAGLAQVACSDAAQWRGVQPPDWRLEASFPCKPDRQTRQLPLAGTTVALTLMSCEAQAHTFGLASADLADPQRVPVALQSLSESLGSHVRGATVADAAASVPGMTPMPQSRRWRIRGQLPDGRPVVVEAVVFSHGLRVYQATMVGPAAAADLTGPFFDGLKVRP